MRLLLPLFLLCCCTVSLFAQAKKGLDQIEERDYPAAFASLKAAQSNPKDRLLAEYGLSKLYSQKRFEHYSLDTAYAYILRAKEGLKSLPEREQKSWERRLPLEDVNRQKSSVERKVLKQAEAEQSVALYDHFLAHYQPSSQRRIGDATRLRNELAITQAFAASDWSSLAETSQRYGTSLQSTSSLLWEQLQDSILIRFFAQQGMDQYPAFAQNFPQHPAVTEDWKGEADALAAADDLSGSIAYVRRHNRDAFGQYQFDRLTEIALRSQKETDLQEWLSIFKKSDDRNAVYRHYYQVYFQDRFLPEAYQQFAAAHPDYPDMDQLQIDQQAAKGRWASQLRQPDANLSDYMAYFRAYPDEQQTDLWTRFTELYLAGKPQGEATRQMLKDYPNHPQAARLKAQQQQAARSKLLQQTRPRAFERYLATYPESATDADIQKAYYEAVIDWDQSADRRRFLELVPTGAYRQKMLDLELQIASKQGDINTINTFAETYPDYQNTSQLQAARKTAQGNVKIDDLLRQAYNKDLTPSYDRFIREHAPNDKAYALLRKMVAADMKQQNYDAAYQQLKVYGSIFKGKSRKYNQLKSALHPVKGAWSPPESISAVINSEGQEYHSILSVDGNTLYFCGVDRAGSLRSGREDVFVAQKVNGEWQVPTLVTDLSKPESNESPFGLSADGTEIILFQEGQLGTAQKTKEGWTPFKSFGPNVNIRRWQSYARFSADGRALFFVAPFSRYDGQKDIWVCVRQADGSWGKATNLGPVINTSDDERSPFLHPDMTTLYFSSDGHEGLGGQDVFVSKRLDDSWTNWSEPVNLGRTVNTPATEWDYKVATDGSYGYFAITPPGISHSDIVVVDVPEGARPEEVLLIKGRVVDVAGQPVGATILWENLSGGAAIQQTEADPRNGRFVATLPTKNTLRVGYVINEPGYFPASGVIEVQPGETEIVLDFPLQLTSVSEIKENKLNLAIGNLFFDTNRYQIKAESYSGLDRVATFLLENDICVEIAGHTDNVGEEGTNQRLSENRANAVRDYFLQKGIAASCLEAKGYGETDPVEDNGTSQGRAKNRRVEIRVR